jgi:NFACT protein RNA binding domain
MFMGKDKYENEELIKFGIPTDWWFHVDNLSSAHCYVRCDTVPDQKILDYVCQLVKQNSIEGCKRQTVDIVYTKHGNLLKTKDMEIGAISYKDPSKVYYIKGVEKKPGILREIEKSRREEFPDLKRLKEDYEAEEAGRQKKAQKEAERREKEEKLQKKKEEDILHYVSFQNRKELLQSNKDEKWAGDGTAEHCKQIEEDFM